MLEQFFTCRYVLARLRGRALGEILDDVASYLKERALASLQEPPGRTLRYRAGHRLLAFLDGL